MQQSGLHKDDLEWTQCYKVQFQLLNCDLHLGVDIGIIHRLDIQKGHWCNKVDQFNMYDLSAAGVLELSTCTM